MPLSVNTEFGIEPLKRVGSATECFLNVQRNLIREISQDPNLIYCNMNRRYIVYGLMCPITNQIRYIGKSTSGLNRPRQHMCLSSLRSNTHKNNWIRNLRASGLRCSIKVLEEMCDAKRLYEREQYWIDIYRPLGFLTNSTDGGPGLLGWRPSADAKKRMAAAKNLRSVGREREIVCLYEAGLTLKEVATATEVSLSHVHKTLVRCSVVRRLSGVRKISESHITKICQMYISGQTLKTIGRNIGVTESTVLRYLKQKGVPSRSDCIAR